MCEGQQLLPAGLHDTPGQSLVKLYCARCEDLYSPKSSRHAHIDGAYFGTSFAHIFFQVFPNMVPIKSVRRYEPRVFGFRVYASAALHRWQDGKREELQDRLRDVGVATFFQGDTDEYDDEDEDEETID